MIRIKIKTVFKFLAATVLGLFLLKTKDHEDVSDNYLYDSAPVPRACIIGAGYSGLGTARTNTPRQTMEYSGFPFPEETPSYPTGPCFYKYLQRFAKHFGLLDNIQVSTNEMGMIKIIRL
ncbi:hypothetical protein HF086_003426 [Spodoptera exigua]|uniref:Flavin-containing monooxygenase n=1 Tax=Spodoptera exigua TaxID=7107 RepID=A0A922MH52_SPOEX|nr:hypothetical protein HF086_003426 [Spodoptera exigua]